MEPAQPPGREPEQAPRGGHGKWMMIACCVPMLVIAVTIALSGAGWGFFFVAVMCTAMMAMMMGAMSGGDQDGHGR
ncbi:MAG: hypothetical protein HZB46_03600 [Solirubrobacterales bacterium]|nr:hypothetical protein [Solirubrobacterales bacterium]